MRVLLIKTSSMGDLIHTLPALTDASRAIPSITFDWVVEQPFAAIPSWHSSVDKTIPVALRRWRKGVLRTSTRTGLKALREELNQHQYDLILDAQGLVKSAFLTYFAKGVRAGLDFKSARESLASFAYQKKYKVNFYQHAVHRMRSLFALALGYPLPSTSADFGLQKETFSPVIDDEKYLVFLFGTTWSSKQWPETYWAQLADLAGAAGYRIKISGYHADEIEQAKRIAEKSSFVDILPGLNIQSMAGLLSGAKGVVAVDTGFAHLAAALDLPTVSIYGATNPLYTGAIGKTSIQLATDFSCSPCLNRVCKYKQASVVTPACYTTQRPEKVWNMLQSLV